MFTSGGKMAGPEENWFAQRNKYTYLHLMMILTNQDVTSVNAIHEKLRCAGKWVDLQRFIKKHKHYNPSGLFELFGDYSDQSADDVRECLMGWILDNYRNVQSWLRMALEHKKLTLDDWMENMRKSLTHGDDIALYLLCRMYDKHVYVHTSRYGWSSLPLKVNEDLDKLLPKCDLELVLLDIWSFGEVRKIRKPKIVVTSTVTTPVIPKNVAPASDGTVITGNVPKTVPCSIAVKRISNPAKKPSRKGKSTAATFNSSLYDMRPRPAPKKVTQRTSGRKRTAVDYSQFDVTSDDPPSPPKKKRSVDLKRRPSALRIAAEKFKTKPSNTPRPTRTRSTASTPATTPVAVTLQCDTIVSTSRTLTTPATRQQTADVLKQLSNMDDIPEDDPNDDTFLPIVPQVQQPPPTEPKAEKSTEPDATFPMLPRVIGTAIKVETQSDTATTSKSTKKVFKTVEYKLKRKYVKSRKFSCVGCNSSFSSQRELNEHFRESHPPVKCDTCKQGFDTPAAMLRHRYKHYEYMYECKVCSRGFQFASQLKEHKRVHQTQGDWVCFRPNCGKRFKRESELNAHLVSHNKKQFKCEKCPYSNSDPRNLRAHKRRHSDELPFKCAFCGQGFKWIQQRSRHVKSGKCPEQNKKQ